MKLYFRVASYFVRHGLSILLGVAVMFSAIGLNLLKPWPIKFLIDDVLQQAGPSYALPLVETPLTLKDALLCVAGSLIVIHFMWGLLNMISNYGLVYVGLKALKDLRIDLYRYLQSLPLRFHLNRKAGDSTFRVAYDSQSIQTLFNKGFVTFAASSATLIGVLLVMFELNTRLCVLAMGVTPMLLFTVSFFANRIRRQTTEYQESESEVLSHVAEGLGGVSLVHAYGREEFEVEQFQKDCRGSLDSNLRLTLTSVGSSFAVGTVMALGMSAMVFVGATEVVNGRMELGDLWVFFAYLTMLYQPLEQLSYTAWAMEGAAAGMERCFEILDTGNDVEDVEGAADYIPKGGGIELSRVIFSYDHKAGNVLNEISLKIEAGQTVALVGATGSGKSTLLSLIPRFYQPESGAVLIDGQDVRGLRKKSLRESMSFVFQDTVLFNTSIFENIAFGRPGATFAEVREAAKAAQIHDFIEGLPEKYRTVVGERGVRLSGGQRQRVSVARAFLRKAPILLMDEPTSSLDPDTEEAVMKSLHALSQNPTTLIVTHRIRTIHHVDVIYVLEQGRVIESGTGAELLERKGAYWKMWSALDCDNSGE